MIGPAVRISTICALVAGVFASQSMGGALARAIAPPQVLVGGVPADGPPAPEQPTKQNKGCLAAGVMPGTDIARVPPADQSLNLAAARALNRGAGVTVAVLDTGVTPNPRLPNLLGGGDYVTSGDGRSDCDAHGTLVAGIIGAAPDPADGFSGIAPDARILSIRVQSGAFEAEQASSDKDQQSAQQIRTAARAIVHAANQGAGVIVMPIPVCVPAGDPVDQTALSEAIGYAVHVKGTLVVAGAGNTGSNSGTEANCQQNPASDPSHTNDPRNWAGVKTIATPAWFGTDVLSVGFTTSSGAAVDSSLFGPWVSVAAVGTGIESLGPGSNGLINGIGAPGKLQAVAGSSYASAYVAGVAALLRSRFPSETPAQTSARLTASAHAPAGRIDNAVGAGLIDPVAALSYRTPPRPPAGLYESQRLVVPPPGRTKDQRPGMVAGMVIVLSMVLGAAAVYVFSARRQQGVRGS